jgi:tetratricopeptide (TPR) repeat protein
MERIEGRKDPAPKVMEYESFLSDYLRARTLEFSGDFPQAALLYSRAAEKGPTYYRIADIYCSAARCRLHLGDAEASRVLAETALEKDAEFLPAYLVLGQALDALGQKDRAEELWAECFRKAEKNGFPLPRTTPEIRKRGLERMKREGP